MMTTKSKIEWTDTTWNPTTGCTKISSGCANCYAEIMTRRLQAMGLKKYSEGFNNVRVHHETLSQPLNYKKPCNIFVNSMSDLFHEAVPDSFIKMVFAIMNQCEQHVFQVLTKRSKRLLQFSEKLTWSKNIWMGVSIEDCRVVDRADHLRQSGSIVKFLSLEPLLGALPNLDMEGIDWIILGGESGPKSRPIKMEWVRDIRDRCNQSNIPFFFKQWGGVNKKKSGRLLDDRIWDQKPSILAS